MEWIRMLVDCWGIMAESAKVVRRIPKLMTLFAILTITTSSLLYLPIFLGNENIRATLISLQWLYLFLIAAQWSFFASATVLASAAAYSGGKNLPLKELLLRTWRTWRRPLSTMAYATLIYCLPFSFWAVNGSPLDLLFDKNRVVTVVGAASVILVVLASVFYAYYSVMCVMGMVVSVLEEKSGVEAIRKGRELVKGMAMQGFVLNIVFVVVSLMACVGMRMVMNMTEYQSEAVVGSIVLSWFWALGLLGMVPYTILYMQCKRICGEEIQVLLGMACGQEDTQPLVSLDLA